MSWQDDGEKSAHLSVSLITPHWERMHLAVSESHFEYNEAPGTHSNSRLSSNLAVAVISSADTFLTWFAQGPKYVWCLHWHLWMQGGDILYIYHVSAYSSKKWNITIRTQFKQSNKSWEAVRVQVEDQGISKRPFANPPPNHNVLS